MCTYISVNYEWIYVVYVLWLGLEPNIWYTIKNNRLFKFAIQKPKTELVSFQTILQKPKKKKCAREWIRFLELRANEMSVVSIFKILRNLGYEKSRTFGDRNHKKIDCPQN